MKKPDKLSPDLDINGLGTCETQAGYVVGIFYSVSIGENEYNKFIKDLKKNPLPKPITIAMVK